MKKIPDAAVVEIVEKSPNEPKYGVIAPNEVRINGVPLLMTADDPVVIHEMSVPCKDLVRVTLTVIARRVSIQHEETTP